MHSASRLPPALLDLLFLRLHGKSLPRCITQWSISSSGRMARSMHQPSLATALPPYAVDTGVPSNPIRIGPNRRQQNEGPLTVRHGKGATWPMTELERRVKALDVAAVAEETQTDIPEFTEGQLLSFYEDLLTIPSQNDMKEADDCQYNEVDQAVVNAIDQRLHTSEPLPDDHGHSRLTTSLLRHHGSNLHLIESTLDNSISRHETQSGERYMRVIARLETIMGRLESLRSTVFPAADETTLKSVPVSLLSYKEWKALICVCVHQQDIEAAEVSLDLMRRFGLEPPEVLIDYVMASYAQVGNVQSIESLMAKNLTESPTERQRHLHIKCHIKATPPNSIPTSALGVLHDYEAQSLPAPMKTYTSVITSLFSTHSATAHAQAWDLFSHMRYVAHPDPDIVLYTAMIRACASSIVFCEPERALDLWTEMTVDHNIAPTAGAYSAVILACARSGTKEYVNEAFRLVKEMLDSHRDAHGRSAFTLDTRICCALLQGAKRVGDLGRARWILAELVKGGGGDEGGVGDEVMMHVFHAYAAYRTPFKRSAVVADDAQPVSSETDVNVSEQHVAAEAGPSFSHIPPQSRAEVIAEVKALFARIREDTGTEKPFGKVRLTARVLNSYLSVFYSHSSLDASEALFRTVFDEVGVQRNAYSYVEALERCALARRGRERGVALAFAEDLWQWLENDSLEGVSPRLIERAHVAFIRILTLSGDLERAVKHVRTFVDRYSVDAVRRTRGSKSALRSTRTVLSARRPLVRMTSAVEVPDESVPPLLTFSDLEVLHHRLVAAGKRDMIGYIKYVCKAYEGAVRTRRDVAMRAEPG